MLTYPVAMTALISSQVKDNSRIFIARGEDIFYKQDNSRYFPNIYTIISNNKQESK